VLILALDTCDSNGSVAVLRDAQVLQGQKLFAQAQCAVVPSTGEFLGEIFRRGGARDMASICDGNGIIKGRFYF